MSSLHVEDVFLGHYQFSHDPFAARTPGFKFYPAQRKSVLGQLHHLARYSQLVLAVTGPRGSGKTLLRQALVASANKDAVQCVVLSARGAGDAPQVLSLIAQGLGIQRADLPSIRAQMAQLALTGQEVYLLVDDAHELADASLSMLVGLASGEEEGRPHVFLFAEPALQARLQLMAGGEERFHSIELEPYTLEDTRGYLAQRLEAAGQGLELLDDEQLLEIQERSGGWPGAINQVARELLIDAMLETRGAQRRAGGLALPRKHLLAVAVVLLGVLGAWLGQGFLERGETQSDAAATPNGVATAAPGSTPSIEFAGAREPVPLPLGVDPQPVMRQPLAEAAGLSEEAAEALPAQPQVTPAPVATVPAQPVAATPAPAVPSAAARPQASATVPAPAPAPAPTPTPAAPRVTTAAPAPAPVAAPRASAPAAAAAPAGAEWYRAQPQGHYVLQILGTRSEASAQAFIRRHGGTYRYFVKLHQGQPLYVVTYGSFSSRGAAQAAIATLPADVRSGKPWPKTFASIRQELAAGR